MRWVLTSLNDHRASWPTYLGNAVPEEGLSAKPADQIASRLNILNIYKLMGLQEASVISIMFHR